MRKFLTNDFAKIGLAVLIVLAVIFMAVFLVPKIQFAVKADEHINIFPSNYSIESVGDIIWHNPQNVFNQNLSNSASLSDFNNENSAFIQGATYEVTTTTESTVTTIVAPSESTTTTISAEIIPVTTTLSTTTITITTTIPEETTTIIVPTTTTLLSETTTSTIPIETTTTTAVTLPPETTTTVPPETTTTTLLPETTATTTAPLSFIKNILSFLMPWANAEETITTTTITTIFPETTTVTTTTIPEETTTTIIVPTTTTLLSETTTSTIPIETTTTTAVTLPPETTTTVPPETTTTIPVPTPVTTVGEILNDSTTSTIVTQETTTTATTIIDSDILKENIENLIPSILIFSGFDLGEDAFQQMASQNIQLRFSLASQKQSDGKLIISYFYHNEWQNAGEIDLSQEVSNNNNGGYFLYALPIFENFQEFQNFKIKFQASGTNLQKIYLDAVWLEADYGKKERKIDRIVNINKNADYSCTVSHFQIDISDLPSTEVKINLTRGKNSSIDEIEIGSLPSGIDLKFKSNAAYIYQTAKDENNILLLITKKDGAQKGSFSIPIIYTKKDNDNFSVLCQINIINQ